MHTGGQIGEYRGFQMVASFDSFRQEFILTLKGSASYSVEIGKDPFGNVQRINNALSNIEKSLNDSKNKMESLVQQLATAKEEVQKPFAQEEELRQKSERLAELNTLLNLDEKGQNDSLGVDEEVVQDGDRNERSADAPRRTSVLARLKEKQEQKLQVPQRERKTKGKNEVER